VTPMEPRRQRNHRRRWNPSGEWRAAILVALAVVGAGCSPEAPTQRPRPSPTPGPPSIRLASSFTRKVDGTRSTLQVVVDPKGSPTEVVYEYGSGRTFDQAFVMAEGLLDAGVVSATTEAIPPDLLLCGRFTATNAFGSASLDVGCELPPVRTLGPPSPSAGPSASP
jgi:hypothetical protein